ncbi:MAG TPA: DUF885 family protein [Pyrinomonadaceae bacterium]|jgi:uncharacterized protein (DUF885 family)
MRKLSILLLLALIILTGTLAPFKTEAQRRRWPGRRTGPTPAQPAASSLVTARFNQLADEYLRGYYGFNPTQATGLGLHAYDSQLESRSREAVTREVRRLRQSLAALARLNPHLLSPEARYDYLVLASHARGQLLELEERAMWQRDPNIYNRLAIAGVDSLLKRNYAPVEQRLDAVLAREREIPRLLDEARANLENPPRIYTEIALAQARGSIEYFARVVPQLVERAGGVRLSAARRAQFESVNETAVRAVRAFAEWLEKELLPRSAGQFAIGEDVYRRKLLYDEMVETPLAQLIRDGERELRRTQEEMRQLAEEIAPGKGLLFALRTLGREHPPADGLLGETRAELDRISAFVRTQGILTPPAQGNLILAETPAYARATTFASMDPPGPFERTATEAYYYVTLPDPQLDERRREEHLSFYNRYALPIISIHEVYPGHYYQFLISRQNPSRLRLVLRSASFTEGWAHYCEQMMLDEGFGGNNPQLRLAQLNLALLRLCRYLVGLRLHTRGMSYEEAVQFFIREGYQDGLAAEREARRGTIDPTYLVYTLGKMEILRLREDYRRRLGEQFRLGEFHDRLLSYGMPPVKIIRLAMLGDAATSANSAPNDDALDQTSRVDFSVLATGTMSSFEGTRRVELILDRSEWQRAWQTIGNGQPLPDVNFNTRAVVLVQQGRKNTGGYSISIEAIRREGTTLSVRTSERAPRPGEMTTQVLTSPFVAVSIPRPPAGAIVKFETDVKEAEQNRHENERNYKRRGRYRRRARSF